ncbi:MAG: fasciclin domain-containing protein [Microthrixaceae bacterium]
MKRFTKLLVPLVLVAVPLVGCSDNGNDEAEATPTTMTADDGATTTMADEPESSDIVDTAIAAGDFTTLVKAVQAAGLEDTLRGEGPFTVFAPTDDAFAALPAGTLEKLLEDPSGDLKSILTYHVVPGSVMAKDVVGMSGQEVETVNGAKFKVNVAAEGDVSISDAAGNTVNVVKTDIETSNGVIHVIDGVLLPG